MADKGILEGMKDVVVEGANKVGDDFHRIVGTEKGKQLDAEAKERELKRMRGPDLDKIFQARRMKEEASRYKKGGKVSSASSRADGIAQRGKTRGKMIMCGGGMIKGKK
jgi:hypothetical protein